MAVRKLNGGAKDPYRTKELGKIHALKNQLGLDDETVTAKTNRGDFSILGLNSAN